MKELRKSQMLETNSQEQGKLNKSIETIKAVLDKLNDFNQESMELIENLLPERTKMKINNTLRQEVLEDDEEFLYHKPPPRKKKKFRSMSRKD